MTHWVVAGTPLDMSQYCRLFSSARIPQRGADHIHTASADTSRHMVVLSRGQFYSLDVLKTDSTIGVTEAGAMYHGRGRNGGWLGGCGLTAYTCWWFVRSLVVECTQLKAQVVDRCAC